MKSKKWLISLGLAVVLVVAFALPSCGEVTPDEYWHTPGDVKISFDISASGAYQDVGLMVVQDLQDFGFDVDLAVLDSSTYYDYLYYPPGGGMVAFISAEDPSPDPWSDWIWMMMGDPLGWGIDWNPFWYNNTAYDALMQQNYFAQNLAAKEEILHELQQILAEDIPMVFLVREQMIVGTRIDHWDNYYNEMGGVVSWINEWSIRNVTPVGNQTRFNIAVQGLTPTLNMEQDALQYTHFGCLYLMMVYENLIGYPQLNEESAYDFVPKLATDYDVTYEADGTGGENQVWTYTLREGVKWHDYDTEGENFTADDVVFTLKYAMSPWGNQHPVNWTAVDEDTGGEEILPEHILVTKTGDYEVQFRYIEGYHQAEDYVPSRFLWYAMVPEHKFEGMSFDEICLDTGDYVGTGPYKVKEFVTDSYLLCERFDDYWGAGDEGDPYWELPAAEEVLFQLYENEGPMWLAFEAGDIDCTAGPSVPHPKKDDYEDNPNIGIEVVPDLSIYYLGFNLHPTGGYEPLLDLALREAIAAIVDKQDIVDISMGGYATTAESWVYPESVMYKDDLPNNTLDLTEAESILTAAGYTKHA
jgi:ABC-type transport system substrate-binding protein